MPFYARKWLQNKVTKFLVTRLQTVADAEEAYEITHIDANDLTQSQLDIHRLSYTSHCTLILKSFYKTFWVILSYHFTVSQSYT